MLRRHRFVKALLDPWAHPCLELRLGRRKWDHSVHIIRTWRNNSTQQQKTSMCTNNRKHNRAARRRKDKRENSGGSRTQQQKTSASSRNNSAGENTQCAACCLKMHALTGATMLRWIPFKLRRLEVKLTSKRTRNNMLWQSSSNFQWFGLYWCQDGKKFKFG